MSTTSPTVSPAVRNGGPPAATGEVQLVRFPRELYQDLTCEARQSRALAQHLEDDRCFLDHRRKLRTARRFRVNPQGQVLHRAHASTVREMAIEAIGCELWPTRASYLYYAPGDFIGPHQDVEQCEYTLVAPLGAEGVFSPFPYEGPLNPVDAFAAFWSRREQPHDGELQLPERTGALFRGDELIHVRRPLPRPSISVTFCFGVA